MRFVSTDPVSLTTSLLLARYPATIRVSLTSFVNLIENAYGDDLNHERMNMANVFGTDILIQAQDPKKTALFYVKHLGFEITDEKPNLISLHGEHINFFIERGPALGPVLEVRVDSVEKARLQLVNNGCEIIKDEPDFPRCYIKDPFGLIYNLTS